MKPRTFYGRLLKKHIFSNDAFFLVVLVLQVLNIYGHQPANMSCLAVVARSVTGINRKHGKTLWNFTRDAEVFIEFDGGLEGWL